MCCYSGLVTAEMLDDLLAQVAIEERRDLQTLEHRGQAADHQVAVTCPESDYLNLTLTQKVRPRVGLRAQWTSA